MSKLIPIEYHGKKYPKDIKVEIEEKAAHFDKKNLNPKKKYSLHTEYSVYTRNMNTNLLENLNIIRESVKNGIPRLWYNKEWANEFFIFINRLIGKNKDPEIIEIHPPFTDYCDSIYYFLDVYIPIELKIRESYPQTKIAIENRCGTRYSGGKFLLSDNLSMIELSRILDKNKLALTIMLDIPQLFSAHRLNIRKITKKEIIDILNPIKEITHNITGLHLWGKKINENGKIVPHHGDLNTYFQNNNELKNIFLNELFNLFNDEKERYFVPEVNSGAEDLVSIVDDMRSAGFIFV